MANLAVVGGSRVNGVSELHSRLLRERLFKDLLRARTGQVHQSDQRRDAAALDAEVQPGLARCSIAVSATLGDRSGSTGAADPARLRPDLHQEWQRVKRENKEPWPALEASVRHRARSDHLIDSQIQAIHEYKRQLLNILHVVSLYLNYRTSRRTRRCRARSFSQARPPGYDMAKRIIHLINSVAQVVNHDIAVRPYLRVIFLPNYGVTLAEHIIPASDISEQISTAGMEASGTGNMKFAMNARSPSARSTARTSRSATRWARPTCSCSVSPPMR
jgi:starch phosphorylase